MKGRVIVDTQEAEEDTEVGGGIDCPNCGHDMRKTIHAKIAMNLTGADEVEVVTNPADTVYVCDAPGCGYRETVER